MDTHECTLSFPQWVVDRVGLGNDATPLNRRSRPQWTTQLLIPVRGHL